ncbi:MAG: SelB C-terminal domain-containing protein [Burkholderiales bacterium]|nr:SelB C-terminal domain-containing protein [Pseudomonadota bacterium]
MKLQPPKVAQLAAQLNADDNRLRTLLRRLAQSGELHAISADYYFPPSTVAEIAAITARLAQQEPDRIFTVARFRTETGVSRNLTIPLLEVFDRVGFTLRVGEGRRVRREWAAVLAGMHDR